jgi:hypothetical protein
MRALPLLLALLAPLAACSLGSTPAYRPVPDGPLRAQIVPGLGGYVSFHVNRPAYVAVFRIAPGRGVTMLYPGLGEEGRYLAAGRHTTWARDSRYGSSHSRFSSDLGFSRMDWIGGFPYGQSYGVAGRTYIQRPEYLYLIASEMPLEVSQFARSYSGLRSALGWQQFAASHPYDVMDNLAELVLPEQTQGEWTTDVYVLWPDPPAQYTNNNVRVVACRNGSYLLVPRNSYATSCPGDEPRQRPVGEGEPRDSADRARKPDRRRPEADGPPAPSAISPRARPGGDSGEATGVRSEPQPRERTRARGGAEEPRTAEPRRVREPRQERPQPRPEARERRPQPAAEPKVERRPPPPTAPRRDAEPERREEPRDPPPAVRR